MKVLALLAASLGFLLPAAAQPAWQLQYFYDEDESAFTVNDLKFPSPSTGIAVGFLLERSRARPASLMTTDGGQRWTVRREKEIGLSIFFLNDSLGWMVTPKGIWRTEEAGRSWSKISSLKNMLRVHFVSPDRGWAVGLRKAVYETGDGGKSWRKVAAAAQPKTEADHTTYGSIAFANPQVGMITGWHRPPRRTDSGLPDWVDPEQARFRREWPGTSIFLDTRDGGKTWTPSTASMFGRVTRIILNPNGMGLGLVELMGPMEEWPSEVYRIDWRTGKSERVYRSKELVITDVLFFPSGAAYLAAIESTGRLRRSPVPGKLRILKSIDFKNWTRMEVDYRASGSRGFLSATDEEHVWAATDTGMVLKLAAHP